MKRLFVVLSILIGASMLLTACGAPAAPAATEAPVAPAAAATDTPAAVAPAATEGPTTVPATATLTPFPVAACQAVRLACAGTLAWAPAPPQSQIPVEQEVVDDYNASQGKVQLILEIVPNASAVDVLNTEIASGNGPDIIGPVGFTGSNAFHGQWLDLKSYVAKIDTQCLQSEFAPTVRDL